MSITNEITLETTPIQWDLTSAAADADEIAAEIDSACRRFAGRYRGRIGSVSPGELAEAVAEGGGAGGQG
jgi:hypothetical protein